TRRLSKAVGRASVGTDPLQRAQLLDQLAARRHALALATVPLPSPWSPAHSSALTATVPAQPTSTVPVPVPTSDGSDEPVRDRGPRAPRGDRKSVGERQYGVRVSGVQTCALPLWAQLLDRLAARRLALALVTVPLPSPWSPAHSSALSATVPAQPASTVPVPVPASDGSVEPVRYRGPRAPR